MRCVCACGGWCGGAVVHEVCVCACGGWCGDAVVHEVCVPVVVGVEVL